VTIAWFYEQTRDSSEWGRVCSPAYGRETIRQEVDKFLGSIRVSFESITLLLN